MKKVLIYKNINLLAPVGGPLGYLYNLKSALDKKDYAIDFLPKSSTRKSDVKKKIKSKLPPRVYDFIRAYKYTKLIHKSNYVPKDYNKYDIIHFHQTTDMYYCREFLKKYKGIVVLTSHSPCVYHKELLANLSNLEVKFFYKKLKALEKIDEYAFERADYIIFPCKESEEPYFNSWDKYASVRSPQKIKYLLTGINQCIPKIPSAKFRKMKNFKDSDFIISYVGRHNQIKGYDNFLRLGQKAIDELNVKVIVGGKNAPLKGYDNTNWREVGWTNDPYSLINCSDVFVLPNKETYFDLVMLEVLSMGKIVLTTYTGGNKYFERFKNSGIFYYDSDKDFIKKLKEIKTLTPKQRKNYEYKNQEIFKNNFTSEIFAQNYIDLINNLGKD